MQTERQLRVLLWLTPSIVQKPASINRKRWMQSATVSWSPSAGILECHGTCFWLDVWFWRVHLRRDPVKVAANSRMIRRTIVVTTAGTITFLRILHVVQWSEPYISLDQY